MKSLLTTCILLYAIASNAQESSDTFQIKDYKYRTPGFKALVFDFNFNGNFSNFEIVDSFKKTENAFNFSPVFINYFRTSSSDKKIQESSYTFYFSGQAYRSKLTAQESKSNRLGGYFSWFTKYQYFKKNNWFWEAGNYILLSGTKENSKNLPNEQNYSSLTIQDAPLIGFGKGRIENVNDAQMALFILNDLEKEGLIQNKGTRDQQYAFAQLITDINNQRIFDNRKKRIYELQRIDSFLKQSGLMTSPDIRHFTTINDNWVYAFTPLRKQGNQWHLRIRPEISFHKDLVRSKTLTYEFDRTAHERTILIGPEAGFESNKAINLKWQRSFGLTLWYKPANIKRQSEEKTSGILINKITDEYNENWGEVNGFYSLGFFPNTRTYINSILYARILKTNYLRNGNTGTIFNSALDIQTSYFLGFRTRLMAGFRVSYNAQELQFFTDKTYQYHGFGTGINLGLSHNIF